MRHGRPQNLSFIDTSLMMMKYHLREVTILMDAEIYISSKDAITVTLHTYSKILTVDKFDEL